MITNLGEGHVSVPIEFLKLFRAPMVTVFDNKTEYREIAYEITIGIYEGVHSGAAFDSIIQVLAEIHTYICSKFSRHRHFSQKY